jgi:hypothetical protein
MMDEGSDTSDSRNTLKRIFTTNKASGWLWWFWLFFMDPREKGGIPKQAAILWSTKNDGGLRCNGKEMGVDHALGDDGSLHGGVAAWYFDGSSMQHEVLLDRVKIDLSDSGIETKSPDTAFRMVDGGFHVVMDRGMEFQAEILDDEHEFVSPWEKDHKWLGYGYEMTGINRMGLSAKVDGEAIGGSCYFQKVLLGAPAVPWYWGVFHFRNGACLTYFNPRILGKSVKKDVSFYDGRELHRFNGIHVRKIDGDLPVFHVSAEEDGKALEFSVEPYAKTVWKFRKKKWGFIPVRFDYGQFPALIRRIRFEDGNNREELTEHDLGLGVGNAEDSRGALF